MGGFTQEYYRLKDGKLKEVKQPKKLGKYGIKLIKATTGILKKYRKTYNSEAFKGKKI